jgi:hypothetical protein
VRTWRRAPWFYGGLMLTLALGIAANAMVVAVVAAVAWRPLPYADQDRIVMFWRSTAARPDDRSTSTVRLLTGWRREAAGVAEIAGVKEYGALETEMDLETSSGIERLAGAIATPNFFDVLGARAVAGRVFSAADDAGGDGDLVVLGHALWTRSFGSDPAIVGRTIALTNGVGETRRSRAYRVLGVLPPGFHFNYESRIEVWLMRPWRVVEA